MNYSDLDWTWSIDGSTHLESGNCDLIDTENINCAWNSLVSMPKDWENSNGQKSEEKKYTHPNTELAIMDKASPGKYLCNSFESKHAAMHVDSMETSEWEATQSFCSDDDENDEDDEMSSEQSFSYHTGPRWVRSTMKAAGKGISEVDPYFLSSREMPMICNDLGKANADSYPTNVFGSVDLPTLHFVSTLGNPQQKAWQAEHSAPVHICDGCNFTRTTTLVTSKSSLFSCSEDLTSRNRDSFMIQRPALSDKQTQSGWVRLKRGLQAKFSPSCIASNLVSIVSCKKLDANGKRTTKSAHKRTGEAHSQKSIKGYCRRQQYLVHRIEESIK